MRKVLTTTIILSLLFFGCNTNSSNNDSKEKELLEKEIELLKKEKELLQDSKAENENKNTDNENLLDKLAGKLNKPSKSTKSTKSTNSELDNYNKMIDKINTDSEARFNEYKQRNTDALNSWKEMDYSVDDYDMNYKIETVDSYYRKK